MNLSKNMPVIKLTITPKDDDKVEFLGRITDSDRRSYLYACDIVCFPSVTRNEGFGLALAEGDEAFNLNNVGNAKNNTADKSDQTMLYKELATLKREENALTERSIKLSKEFTILSTFRLLSEFITASTTSITASSTVS